MTSLKRSLTLKPFLWVWRISAVSGAVLLVMSSTGCRIGPDYEREDYSAYGGAWERTRRDSGRVGSLFDPGGVLASNLNSKEDPLSPSEQERKRQAENPDQDNLDQILEDETDRGLQDEGDRLRERQQREEELNQLDVDDLGIEEIEVRYLEPAELDLQ